MYTTNAQQFSEFKILCKEPLVNNILMPIIYAAQACLQRCRNTGIITKTFIHKLNYLLL